MTDWLNKTHIGDCRAVMRQMLADKVRVQTIVTSAPYWGLRDYGVKGQIGMERSLGAWVRTITEVFELCRQLLAKDGTLWLNLGDAYANDGKWGGKTGGKRAYLDKPNLERVGRSKRRTGLKEKELMGQPWRAAFALQKAGWYLRSDVIWHKLNPLPESVKDRPTKAHEYIFLMTKSAKYYYDADAIKEPCSADTHARMSRARSEVYHAPGQRPHLGESMGPRENTNRAPGVNPKAVGRRSTPPDSRPDGQHRKGNSPDADGHGADRSQRMGREPGWRTKQNESFSAAGDGSVDTRNKRTVWSVPTESFSGAHYATFPQDLIIPCILAGAPAGGIVFDPFMGSGTTGQVATSLGRQFIGIDLDPRSLQLAADHRQTTMGLAL